MGRRAAGEGSVYRSKDGRWRGAVNLGWEDGQRKRKVVSGRTQQEALRKLKVAQRASEVGVVTDGKATVGAWLEGWLATVVDGRSGSDNTRQHYAQQVHVHLVPALGKVRLDKLTPEQVDGFLAAKADAGLGRTYISRMRSTLIDALRHAQRRRLVTVNVAELAVMPKTEPAAEKVSMTAAEAKRLLDAARGERLEALIVVGLTVGLRPGELTGLLWSDLKLAGGAPTLTVSGSMKRGPDGSVARGDVKRATAGRRTVALPPVTVRTLRGHRKRQEAERRAAAGLWVDQGLVFPTTIGTPLDPSRLRTEFRKVAAKAKVEAKTPYAMRHACVSLLLDAKVSIEEVADLLGDDPATLYRAYRHRVQPVAKAGVKMGQVLA